VSPPGQFRMSLDTRRACSSVHSVPPVPIQMALVFGSRGTQEWNNGERNNGGENGIAVEPSLGISHVTIMDKQREGLTSDLLRLQ
jgi:hypothetical protein